MKVYGLRLLDCQPLTSVVRLEDTKCLAILGYNLAANSPDAGADPVGRGDEELARRQLLDEDLAIGKIAESLDAVRKSHDVAVANPPDLHQLHISKYIRVYTNCQALGT